MKIKLFLVFLGFNIGMKIKQNIGSYLQRFCENLDVFNIDLGYVISDLGFEELFLMKNSQLKGMGIE